jgi:hypothetical protein
VLLSCFSVHLGGSVEMELGLGIAMPGLAGSAQAVERIGDLVPEQPTSAFRERGAAEDTFIVADGGGQPVSILVRRLAGDRGADRVLDPLVDRSALLYGREILRGQLICPCLRCFVQGRAAGRAQDKKPVPVRQPAPGIRVAFGLPAWPAGEFYPPGPRI